MLQCHFSRHEFKPTPQSEKVKRPTCGDFVVVSEAWSPRAAPVTHGASKTQVPDDLPERKFLQHRAFSPAAFKVAADVVLKYFN